MLFDFDCCRVCILLELMLRRLPEATVKLLCNMSRVKCIEKIMLQLTGVAVIVRMQFDQAWSNFTGLHSLEL